MDDLVCAGCGTVALPETATQGHTGVVPVLMWRCAWCGRDNHREGGNLADENGEPHDD